MTRGVPEVVSASEAARIKGVSRSAVSQACARGDLDCYRTGRTLLVRRPSLDAWTPDPGQVGRWTRVKETEE
jgi:excisionase family DNA binding protein